MLRYLWIPLLWLSFTAIEAHEGLPWYHDESNDSKSIGYFSVHKHVYTFCTEFELQWQGEQYARAMKSVFHLRTQYDLYDANGNFAGQAVESWLPGCGLGWLYSWAADLIVYDSSGTCVGSIHGTFYTEAVAKFIFRDDQDNIIAAAFMDKERANFVVQKADSAQKKIAEMDRRCQPYKTDYWTVQLYDDSIIPPELIQVFAIFACDRQEEFKVGS